MLVSLLECDLLLPLQVYPERHDGREALVDLEPEEAGHRLVGAHDAMINILLDFIDVLALHLRLHHGTVAALVKVAGQVLHAARRHTDLQVDMAVEA